MEAGVRYFLGMSCSSATASILREAPSVGAMRRGGFAQQATAHPLPANPTLAQVTSGYIPMFALDFVI